MIIARTQTGSAGTADIAWFGPRVPGAVLAGPGSRHCWHSAACCHGCCHSVWYLSPVSYLARVNSKEAGPALSSQMLDVIKKLFCSELEVPVCVLVPVSRFVYQYVDKIGTWSPRINSVRQRCLITHNNFPICSVNILIRWPPGDPGHCRYYCDICNNSGQQIGCYPSRYPDMTWMADSIFYGYFGQLVPHSPTYNFSFTASPELGLIELVTLLLREVIRQYCSTAPIQSQPTITCNINQFYNAQKRNY